MRRRVRPEAARGLLQLALAADLPVAPGLIPRHRHVDEALEEVSLSSVGRTPRGFELLVRREVLAAPQELDAALERLFPRKNLWVTLIDHGDDPAGGRRPLLQGQARGAAAGPSSGHDRQRRSSGPRYLRHRPGRPG